MRIGRRLNEDRPAHSTAARVGRAAPVFDPAIDAQDRLVAPGGIPRLACEKVPVVPVPAHPGHHGDAGAATKNLAHVHRDGASVQVRARLRAKVPVPFGTEVQEPLPGLVHARHVIVAAGLNQEDGNLRVLRQPSCHDRPRRT